MCLKAEDLINSLNVDLKTINLVSGGAAWSDHVAIYLFLTNKYGKLTLYLPCHWNSDLIMHEDNNKTGFIHNPDKSANKYHNNFSKVLGYNTLHDIENAKLNKAIIVDDNIGFHKRNTLISKSEYLIAFSWAKNEFSIEGGTLDTWKKCKGKKIHIDLACL